MVLCGLCGRARDRTTPTSVAVVTTIQMEAQRRAETTEMATQIPPEICHQPRQEEGKI